MSEHSSLIHHNSSKSRQRFKDVLGKSREFQTICLNQSQLKHMHAIRPYCSKERKTSRKDSRYQSPGKLSRSKSKRLDNSSKKTEQWMNQGNKQLSDLYGQLLSLKSEHKMLKSNMKKLTIQKKEEEEEKKKMESELQSTKNELERQKRNNTLLQKQIERIKKECIRLVELQRFKTKKTQETLQQKELMIAYLRNSLQNMKQGQPTEPPTHFFINSSLPISFDYFNKPHLQSISQINHETSIHNIKQPKSEKCGVLNQEDSLSFSRDKSKQTDSIIHSFLSYDQSLINHNFTKKDNILINSLNQSPIVQQIEIIDEKSQKSEKSITNNLHSSDIEPENSVRLKKNGKSSKKSGEKHQECLFQIEKHSVKMKINPKNLQISITDQNVDTSNLAEELQTKKKTVGGFGCRQKKKMTVKKSKLS